ncbi:MAG TPA: ABC transporter substrate-binding protein [Gemmatimonadaceae bacterium]|nr:ABC transporter substrate-binding protein [Gemmatimonadaceae bacterium]
MRARVPRLATACLAAAVLGMAVACARERDARGVEVTVSGSALGAEGEILRRQAARFSALHPDIRVRVQPTPDDATQRHQLYVQWLNARAGDPDILQLDVVWTAEFAAAGWILPLDRYAPDTAAFFDATIAANRWAGRLYALPWFVDAGMLYWRTDLLDHAPATMAELHAMARTASAPAGPPRAGIVWQGARYEGLITVFLEYLTAFGGRIMTDDARVVVDSPEAARALTTMRDEIGTIAPPEVLTWHEEETRFAFQNGDAALMRNWPYAYALMNDSTQSRVAGRYAVAPIPPAPGGEPAAALGGAQLAVNAHSDVPDAAYAVIAYLTAPAQMLERAEVAGQFPTRRALFDDQRLARALAIPVDQARAVLERTVPRPVTPIYSQLSELLQIQLHRALTRQATPDAALRTAAAQMNALVERTRVRELTAGAGAPEGR